MNFTSLLLESPVPKGASLTSFLGAICIMSALVLVSNSRKRAGTMPEAMKKVSKKYKAYLSKDAQILTQVPFENSDSTVTVDKVIIDEHGVMLVKVIYNMAEIYGQPKSEVWKGKTAKEEKTFPNPIVELEGIVESVRKLFSDNGIYNVPITNHAVFYLHHGDTQLFLGNTPQAYPMSGIKKVMAKHNESPIIDININAVSNVLKAHRENSISYLD